MNLLTAALLLAIFPALCQSQAAAPQALSPAAPASPAQSAPTPPSSQKDETPAKLPRTSDRRHAASLFLEASKLFEKEQFEEAMDKYRQAAELDPSSRNYALAGELARSHAVTALIQASVKDRIRGDAAAERAALEHALALDPKNIQVTEHLYELGDEAIRGQASTIYGQAASTIGDPIQLLPSPGVHSFHVHTDQRSAIEQVFKAYGLEPSFDDSIRRNQTRLDVDDVNFEQATQVVGMLTRSFYVPLDTHRVLVASDTPENRKQFERLDLETIYLPGLAATELTEVGALAKGVFDLQQAVVEPSAGTITLRAPASTMNAFNATIRDLIDGHSQVLLEVNLIQIAHTSESNTGVRPPQSISAFNVYAEEQSILNSNQALVQQIVSSGLAAPGDTLAIL